MRYAQGLTSKQPKVSAPTGYEALVCFGSPRVLNGINEVVKVRARVAVEHKCAARCDPAFALPEHICGLRGGQRAS
jgi:hypothetical protein